MASLYKLENGRFELSVFLGNVRRKISMGKTNKKAATIVEHMVEKLVFAKNTNTVPDYDVTAWVTELPIDSRLFQRLVKLELVKPRIEADRKTSSLSIKDLLDRFMAFQGSRVKPASQKKAKDSLGKLLNHFSHERLIRDITVGDAKNFDAVGRGTHSEAHQRTLNRYAKQLFQFALENRWVDCNPFESVKSASIAGKRNHYVDGKQIESILANCVDPKLKLVIALARYAGLRVPSEVLSLAWSDIRLDESPPILRIAHHKTKERCVPIVPELRPFLVSARRTEGKVVVGNCGNLRRQFGEVLARLEIEPWEKLFQTLRQSCENDLVRRGVNSHAVAAWMGHSVRVSQQHYMMVTSDDFAKVTSSQRLESCCAKNSEQNSEQHTPETERKGKK